MHQELEARTDFSPGVLELGALLVQVLDDVMHVR
jgi:hypothetical protein